MSDDTQSLDNTIRHWSELLCHYQEVLGDQVKDFAKEAKLTLQNVERVDYNPIGTEMDYINRCMVDKQSHHSTYKKS